MGCDGLSAFGSRALYRLGRATAADIMEALPDAPAYSTVRTQLRVLESKGHVRHDEEGLRYVYSPTGPRHAARRSALRHVIETFFDGSSAQVVAALLGAETARLSDAELRRDAEQACDDIVLAGEVRAEAYASHLVEIARASRAIKAVAVMSMAGGFALERRIVAMLQHDRDRRPLTRRVLVCACAGLLGIALPMVPNRRCVAAAFRRGPARVGPLAPSRLVVRLETAAGAHPDCRLR
jgi:predicted transcriptional regulator